MPSFWWSCTAKEEYFPSKAAEVPKEPMEHVEKRIQVLLEKINTLPQKHIAIVGHSAFFKRLTKQHRKLANCEIHHVELNTLLELNHVSP